MRPGCPACPVPDLICKTVNRWAHLLRYIGEIPSGEVNSYQGTAAVLDRSSAYFHQYPDIQSPAVSRFFLGTDLRTRRSSTPTRPTTGTARAALPPTAWRSGQMPPPATSSIRMSPAPIARAGSASTTRPLCLLMETTASRCWLRTQSAPAPTAPGWISP